MPMSRWPLLPALAIAAVACGLGGAGGPPPEDAVRAAAEGFLADLRDGRWEQAYARLHTDRQVECSSPARLGELVVAAGEQPRDWTLRAPRVRKRTAQIGGEVIHSVPAGRGTVELSFDRVGEGWQITNWSASSRELCREVG
jgi:hypothetical protein